MKHSTSLTLCALALCLFSAQSASATAESKLAQPLTRLANINLNKFISTPQGIAATCSMIALFVFFARKPDTAPDRYDLEAVKNDPSFKNIFKFVYYYILDGVLGHASQGSSAKIGEDGKTVVVKPSIPARGGLGQISEMIKPLSETLKFIATSASFLTTSMDGIETWANAFE